MSLNIITIANFYLFSQQDPNDKRRAILNEPLKELLGVPEVTCLTLSSRVAKHLHPL